MTSPFGFPSLTFERAFLQLNPATKMWIQFKSNQIASVGRFGPCELSALKQEMKTRFGPAASAGNPPLTEVAIQQVLQRMRQELASVAGGAQPASPELQKKLQQQMMLLQLLGNVSKSYHDTAKGTIQNLRG
jgi:hypothetical protein